MVAKTSSSGMAMSMVMNFKVRLSISPKCSPIGCAPLEPPQKLLPARSRTRVVRFADHSRVHELDEGPASDMTDAFKASIWYQPNDYEYFKDNAHSVARGIRERHRADPQNPRSFSNVLAQTYEACVQQVEPPVEALAKWLSVAYTQRGLEMMSVKSVKDDRQARSRYVVRATLEEFRRGSAGDGLRAFSEQLTQSTKLFASAIAQADFLCLQSDAQFKPACDIYQEKDIYPGIRPRPSLSHPIKKIITQRKSPQIPYGAKRA